MSPGILRVSPPRSAGVVGEHWVLTACWQGVEIVLRGC